MQYEVCKAEKLGVCNTLNNSFNFAFHAPRYFF